MSRKVRLSVDPELSQRLCSLLAGGCSVRTACEATGLSESTFFDYLRRAAPEHSGHEPRFLEFSQRVTRARGDGKAKLIGFVAEAARTDWRAALALLERIAPDEYGRVVREDKPDNGLLPAGSVQPIVNVVVHRDEATDEARKRFGAPPPNRTRCASLPMPD